MRRCSPTRRSVWVSLVAVLLTAAALPAQERPFVYSSVPSPAASARVAVFSDVAIGRHLFAGLGPERVEQRLGLQVAIGSRARLDVEGGWAPSDPALAQRVAVRVELMRSLTAPTSRLLGGVGLAVSQEYSSATTVGVRAGVGYRGARTLAVGNVRLERAISAVDASGRRRDALDVLTTVGLARIVSPGLRVGVEALGEDLEGLVNAAEAEGGARVMLGPSITVAPPRSPWSLAVVGGPVFQMSRSTSMGSSATRDLTQQTGFVLRTAVGYRW